MQSTATTPQPTPADWLPITRPDGFNHPFDPEPRNPEYHALRESLFAEFAPQGCYEFDLVEDIVSQRWGLKLNQRREADLIVGNRAMARHDFDRVMNAPKSADFPELRKIALAQTIEFCLDEHLRLSGNPPPVSGREIRSRESQLRRSLSATLSELRRIRKERSHHLAGEQRRWKDAKNQEFFEAKAQSEREIVANCEILAADSATSLPVTASSEPERGPETSLAPPQPAEMAPAEAPFSFVWRDSLPKNEIWVALMIGPSRAG